MAGVIGLDDEGVANPSFWAAGEGGELVEAIGGDFLFHGFAADR